MHFEELEVGEFHIYAGAMETPGGYTATVAVRQAGGHDPSRIVYRDEAMAGGYAWFQPKDALQYAIANAQKWIRRHCTQSQAQGTALAD